MRQKIKSQKSLEKILARSRKRGKRIVFTNGCFDLIHPGHIRYLRRAKEAGDVLVIGLNSDASVRKLKGRGRPLMPQQKRAEVVASLESVDYVTVFSEPTPLKLIEKVRPHVLAKGGDWKRNAIVGKDFVESHGGRVRRIPYVKGYSTSQLIRRICQRFR
jgi:D-beta-D-heptose 7-phosphate kinase/D-beta-D-heptose 1-phosphate adenosyltransferase